MIGDPWRREFDVACQAVRDGAILARDIRRQIVGRVVEKPDRSPVTVADFAVQALIAHRLASACPGIPLVAEEDASPLRTPAGEPMLKMVRAALNRAAPDLDSTRLLDDIDRGCAEPGDRFWTLDPVDGTQGFVRGDQYVVALALIVDGRVELGLLGCPELSPGDGIADRGCIVVAVRNRGAFRASLGGEFTPVRVSSVRDVRLARVLRSFEADHIDLETFNAIVGTLEVQTPPSLMDSQAKHAVIATGGADLLIRVPAAKSYRDKIWDQAAGSLIVEEAGGQVTDLRGVRLDFGAGRLLTRNEGAVASNGFLHAAVLGAAERLTGQRG